MQMDSEQIEFQRIFYYSNNKIKWLRSLGGGVRFSEVIVMELATQHENHTIALSLFQLQ